MSLESAPSEGSTFRVYLPLDASQVLVVPKTAEVAIFTVDQLAAAQRALAPGAESRGTTVLIVEDDDTFGRALVRDLEAAGYVTVWARHGDDALRLVKEVQPAVVTLDLALPGVDGWEILKALKSEPSTARVPVIIVSLVENHELGFALGADDYFLKPLERRQFLARLEDLVADPGSEGTGALHRVLVIDDDPQVQDLLGEALDGTPFQIVAALDGRSGIEKARREPPAVIVLDLMLPGLTGFEVAAQLRADPATASVPIVVLTAKDLSAEDRSQLLGTTEGLLTKAPMDRAELVRTIQQVALRSSVPQDPPPEDDGSGVEGDELTAKPDSHPDQQQDRDTGEPTGQTEP